MSLITREAQHGRIQRTLKLVEDQIRPRLERAVGECKATGAFTLDVVPDRSDRDIIDNTLEGESVATPALADEPAVSPPFDGARPHSPTPGSATDVAPCGQEICLDRVVHPSENAPSSPGLTTGRAQGFGSSLRDTPTLLHLQGKTAQREVTHQLGCLDLVSLDLVPLARIETILRHLRSSQSLPDSLFKDATPGDLLFMDDYCGKLRRIAKAINNNMAALIRNASEKFDNRIQSSGIPPGAHKKSRRRFWGQEEWETARGRKTDWDPHADWGSEMAWAGANEDMGAETIQSLRAKQYVSSRLRYTCLPTEWSWSSLDSLPEEADADSYW